MENTLAEIADALEHGRCKRVKDLVRMALREGYDAGRILESGILKGMDNVARRFQVEMVAIPEILAITRAMNGGVEALAEAGGKGRGEQNGTVLIGTMRRDVHDMGKNLIRILLENKGLRVIDLGVEVPTRKFVDAAVQEKADVVICSGFMKDSVIDMMRMIEAFEERGIRQDVYIMVGGAALNESLAKQIGADCYTLDAVSCGEKAYAYCKKKQRKKEKYTKSMKNTLS